MWISGSDEELVSSSELILTGTYLGQTEVRFVSEGQLQNVGVLHVSEVIKGSADISVVLLKVPSQQGLLRRSDQISFTPGQQGLWFLRPLPGSRGVFLADHPDRFIPEQEVAEKMKMIQRLISP